MTIAGESQTELLWSLEMGPWQHPSCQACSSQRRTQNVLNQLRGDELLRVRFLYFVTWSDTPQA